MAGHPAGATVTVYERSPKHPFAAVARTVNVKVPAVVNVPDNTPAGVSVRPAGNAPAVTANVYGAVPPLADKGWVTTMPTAAFGSAAGASAMAGHAVPAQAK